MEKMNCNEPACRCGIAKLGGRGDISREVEDGYKITHMKPCQIAYSTHICNVEIWELGGLHRIPDDSGTDSNPVRQNILNHNLPADIRSKNRDTEQKHATLGLLLKQSNRFDVRSLRNQDHLKDLLETIRLRLDQIDVSIRSIDFRVLLLATSKSQRVKDQLTSCCPETTNTLSVQ